MNLPNGERTQLDQKLELYSLNMEHENGKHKAILFKKRLGITIENKEILETALLKSAIEADASIHISDRHGTQYDVRFQMTTETFHGSRMLDYPIQGRLSKVNWYLSCQKVR